MGIFFSKDRIKICPRISYKFFSKYLNAHSTRTNRTRLHTKRKIFKLISLLKNRSFWVRGQKETTKFNVLFKFWYATCQKCSWNVWLSFNDKLCWVFYRNHRVCAFFSRIYVSIILLSVGLTSYRRLFWKWLCYAMAVGNSRKSCIFNISLKWNIQYILFEMKYFR